MSLDDLETCSWCLIEIPWARMKITNEGNLCGSCYVELLNERKGK